VIAATNDVLEREATAVKDTLKVIYKMNREFMADPDTVKLVSKRYKQQPADVLEWFGETLWSTSNHITSEMIEKVIYTLIQTEVLDKNKSLTSDQLIRSLY